MALGSFVNIGSSRLDVLYFKVKILQIFIEVHSFLEHFVDKLRQKK